MWRPVSHWMRNTSQGLAFNSQLANFPFMCKCCTVRANVWRDLTASTHPNMQLLMLERMQMVDCSNAWAHRTSQSIAGSLQTLGWFTASCRMPWSRLNTVEIRATHTAPRSSYCGQWNGALFRNLPTDPASGSATTRLANYARHCTAYSPGKVLSHQKV